MGITLRVWAYGLFVSLLVNAAFTAKVAKIRLEDIENDNNKKTQEVTQAAPAAAKQQPQLIQQGQPGAFLPQQYFQFPQQGLPDYSAAFQGGSHPQLYLGQRDQLGLLDALGHQQSAFTASPFHGLYGQADGQGLAHPSSFSFGHLPIGGIPASLPAAPPASGPYAVPSPPLFAQGSKLQVEAKLQQQQSIQPQLQYQQIPQKQQIPQQLQLKAQPQLQQQFQQVVARPQYIPQQGHQLADQQQQIAALQQQFAAQQPYFQQYLQQLTQHPQYQQQLQAAHQQQQLQAIPQQLQAIPQQIQAVQHQPQLQQQHLQLQPQQLQLQQPQLQLQQQQLQLHQQQPQVQVPVQAGNAKFQPSQEVKQSPIAIPQQYFQSTQGQQQYLQPGQHQFLQAAQQDLLSARPVFQQPFVYQGDAAVAAQPQKAALQSFSGGNQILVGYGGNQVSDKSPALAVKREGPRRGVRPGESALAGAVAYARGGYTS